MRTHLPLIFFSLFYLTPVLFAEPVCTLLQKDVDSRKYSFRCDNRIVNISCENEDEQLCKVDIKDQLESLSFRITGDQIESFGLFSKTNLTKNECDASKKLCKLDANVCKKYQKYFDQEKNIVDGKTKFFRSMQLLSWISCW